jgi:hypothetical protein
MVRGPSRHVVRFVSDGERVYALKEMAQPDAEREYAMLRLLATEGLPAVEAVGLVTGRATRAGEPLDAVLVTRYLDYSLPFHHLFSAEGVPGPGFGRRLVDAGVVLLARLHLDGVYWGDCSLSPTWSTLRPPSATSPSRTGCAMPTWSWPGRTWSGGCST